ncbi:Nramp family divalent metal transporter [Cumulibacter manganitolerans]|uniref:Nramp family divalent metal transporter n=1 Tax=Cumulibacter manganitolerans TaxID=1884992 RepID=UPI0012957D24|nr:Nramp family divalent metal transporter [Cumulibacter manganitolerans]
MLQRSRVRQLFVLGPAFVVATAFIDPGNVATNMVAGSTHGYLLLWVVVGACIVGAFVQYLAAKLGLATGHSLAAEVRRRYPRPVSWALWAIAEIIVVLTDLAEFIGGAIALNLLFGVPLLVGALIVALSSVGIIALRMRGKQVFTAFTIGLLFAVVVAYVVMLARVGVGADAVDGLVPRLDGAGSVLLAAGIIGATVMPHALFLHSTLSKEHADADEARMNVPKTLAGVRRDIGAAMTVAGFVNVAILLTAATIPTAAGQALDTAAAHLGTLGGLDVVFGVALLAAALASACTGVYSGQTVMADFLGRRLNVWLRRAVTIAPSLVIIALASNPTQALVLSQVGLSLCLPFALIPLIHLTSSTRVMGAMRNHPVVLVLAAICAVLITGINLALLIV